MAEEATQRERYPAPPEVAAELIRRGMELSRAREWAEFGRRLVELVELLVPARGYGGVVVRGGREEVAWASERSEELIELARRIALSPQQEDSSPVGWRIWGEGREMALLVADRRSGARVVVSLAGVQRGEEARHLLELVGQVAAEALVGSPLGSGGVGSEEKLTALMEVSNYIAAQLELREVIRAVVEKTSALLAADRSSVFILDDEREELYTIVAQGLESIEIRIPLGQGIAGYVARTGETVNIADAYEHPAFDPTWDRKSGYRTRSMLCMPLRNRRGETIGVFQVMNKLDGDRFSQEDEELLRALSGAVSVAIENALLYEEQKKQFDSFIKVLATTIDSRDPTTGMHTVMVTGIAVLIAREMGLTAEEVEKIRIAATLHDIGKIAIPDAVLRKPTRLSREEFEIMKRHALYSILILRRIRFRRDLRDIPEIAGAHHERIDGGGYPFGLKGEELTLPMRILAVADVFHALIQDRPYKKGLSLEEAVAECERMTMPYQDHHGREVGRHLDPEVVGALRAIVARLGPGRFEEEVVRASGFEAETIFSPEEFELGREGAKGEHPG